MLDFARPTVGQLVDSMAWKYDKMGFTTDSTFARYQIRSYAEWIKKVNMHTVCQVSVRL